MDELGVLDPRAQAARPPRVGRGCERIEAGADRAIADRVNGDGEAELRGLARDVGQHSEAEQFDARPAVAVGLQHGGRP